MTLSTQRGLTATASVIMAAVAIIAVAAAYYVYTQPAAPPEAIPSAPEAMIKPEAASPEDTAPMPGAGDAMTKSEYTGTVLAGTSAPLLDFVQADFDAAVSADKLIVLYFYANWCPICAAEFPLMQQAFNELTTDQVVGFRVNFNDDQTDADEETLARQHGVAYQHTKVLLKDGRQILKSPESWTADRYRTEITKAAPQP